jgi:hypothetical protein
VPTSKNPAWAELIQLLPIVNFALPFIVRGEVDLEHARRAFLFSALLTLPISALVLRRGYVLNPILLGTAVWLWLAAVAFGSHVESLRLWLVQSQGFALFVAIFVTGLSMSLLSPHGYIGARSTDVRWVKRTSLSLLGLSAVALVWAYYFRQNIRLGGGLPFIVLNVVRRVLIVRADRATTVGA